MAAITFRRTALLLLFAAAVLVLSYTYFAVLRPDSAYGAIFIVNDTGDAGDATPEGTCDSGGGVCTLREAIQEANALAGADVINFAIPGVGPHTIVPGSALPTITDPVTIDGYSQPGALANTNAIELGSNAVLKIELDGTSAGSANGLRISAGGSTVKGLVINRFAFSGILIFASGGNTIEGNYIGTDVAGTADLGNSIDGVFISGPPNNTVGGTAPGARNVLSGNTLRGVEISGSGASGNLVQGNYIGTDATGGADLGNSGDGVVIVGGPTNTIGGTPAGARNVISGNAASGVLITGGSSATGNLVQGNFIGTNATGAADLGNTGWGVVINGAPNNTIGGTATAARNIMSGNDSLGIEICCSGATGNLVQGNYIGTDVTGTLDVGNTIGGVFINSADSNTVGGTVAGARNVISGNDGRGVSISAVLGATGNLVQGNYIGTDATGSADLGNSTDGVHIHGGCCGGPVTGNTIGGSAAGARNVISGNGASGVLIEAVSASGNLVQGNFIGTDVTGTVDLGNTKWGVLILGPSNNTIGGTAAGARNLISGNDTLGIEICCSGATGNLVQGNFVGTDVTGTADLGNASWGVLINNAPTNTIGGPSAGARNVISGNGSLGIEIVAGGATGNLVQGNYIGTDVTGTMDVGNTTGGVFINGSPSNTVGGAAAGAGNVISGNDARGLTINNTGSLVQGNYIGTDATGTLDLGNSTDGVAIFGATNTVGGTAGGARNVISGNGSAGIILGGTSTGILVQGNFIGTDATGTVAVGNLNGVDIQTQTNTIGGTSPGEGNLISGNRTGVIIGGAGAFGNLVQGNFIGTDVSGTSPLGNLRGIHVGANSNTIGGGAPGAPNLIAYNSGGDGVSVTSGAGNAIRSNSIFSNSELGIDLGPDPGGVTANDLGDPDAGANDLQNFPVLTSAASGGGSTTIVGSLNSTPNSTFALEFYSSPVCDPSTFGEGKAYLGSSTQTTDGSGNVAFSVTLGVGVSAGDQVTSTATNAGSSTSEFSKCVPATLAATPTATATATATATPTATATATATPTPTPSPSPTPTPPPPLPCPGATPPPFGTCPPTPTAPATPTVTPTPTPSPSPTPTPTAPPPTATPTPGGTPAAVGGFAGLVDSGQRDLAPALASEEDEGANPAFALAILGFTTAAVASSIWLARRRNFGGK